MMFQQFIYNPSEIIKEQYEVRTCIGEGSEGEVYLVRDRCADRLLALKVVLFDNDEKKQCYEKQVRMLTRFGGTYFPVLVNNFTADQKGYILMEYVEGENLKSLIERKGSLDVKEALDIIREIGNALKQLHRENESVVFGDLKAENIIIQKDFKIKIVDFGGSFDAGDKGEINHAGTFGYAPKEQWEKGKIARTWWDIYALNKLLHYMLTGNDPALPPYTAPSILEFDITLPKPLDVLLTKYTDEEECRKTEVEEYVQVICNYRKTEYLYFFKEFVIKSVEHVLVFMAVLLFYLSVWGQNFEEIIHKKENILISFLLFLIAFLYRKIFIHKRFCYRYRREKSIWRSAKKGIYVSLIMLLFTSLNTKAQGEKEVFLPVIFYNDTRECVCVAENAVLKVCKNLMVEIPIENIVNEAIYELEISCKLKGDGKVLKRKILFKKKP